MTDNLGDLLDKLATAVQEHATVTDKAIRMLSGQIEEVWADNAALRDELHSTNAALANRLEAATRNGDKYHGPCSECGAPIYMDKDRLWRDDSGGLHTCGVSA